MPASFADPRRVGSTPTPGPRTGTPSRTLADRSFKRILIVKPSSLGDIIHALPVLHGLRRRFPDATLHWLIAKPFAPLMAGHPDLDDVVVFDRSRYGRFARALAPSLEFIGFLKRLRAEHYDLTIDLQGLFRSGFLSFTTGASVRIGFADAREFASYFYTHRVGQSESSALLAPKTVPSASPDPADTRPDMHAADRNYLVSRLLDFYDTPMRFDLAVTDDERRDAARILAAACLDPAAPLIALWPGARWETKRWPAEKFAAVVDRLAEVGDIPLVLMGDPTERALCRSIAEQTAVHPAVLAGKTSIRQAVAVLERAALVITHDSAPMHMAAALGRPLVAILGPTNPRRTGPHGRLDAVVQSDIPCAPCYLKRLAQCPHDHRCMRDLEVADVVRSAERALTERATRPMSR